MPLHSYGVLKGRPIDVRSGRGSAPHYQIRVVDDTTDYRIAVNVKSKLSPSELLYLVDENFRHPITESIKELKPGFTPIKNVPGETALDYIRGNLFNKDLMTPLPYAVPGPDNDLNEKIAKHVTRALGDECAMIYAFGERWGPENGKKDKYFGFSPGNGIHDIHMNQGNVGKFVSDDGVWQDGGLLIHFPDQSQWIGIFLAFQSQAWHTDDSTGHAISAADFEEPTLRPGAPGADPDGLVRIVAALVNPSGEDVGAESVTLVNSSPVPVNLEGWAVADRNKNKEILSARAIAPGAAFQAALSGNGAQLSNKGGIITLLDKNGIKVHGVSYTKSQAQNPGWTIVF